MSTLSPSSSDLALVDWAQQHGNVGRRQVRFNQRECKMSNRRGHEPHVDPGNPFHVVSTARMSRNTPEHEEKTVKRMAKGHPEDNVNRSHRGLEHLRSRDVLLAPSKKVGNDCSKQSKGREQYIVLQYIAIYCNNNYWKHLGYCNTYCSGSRCCNVNWLDGQH